jgi:hypothetical protein
LLLDDLLEVRDLLAARAVGGLDAGAVAVVAGAAGGLQVFGVLEQLGVLRAWEDVVSGVGDAAAASPADLALVPIAREHVPPEPLPGSAAVAAVAHGSNDA